MNNLFLLSSYPVISSKKKLESILVEALSLLKSWVVPSTHRYKNNEDGDDVDNEDDAVKDGDDDNDDN